MKIKVKKSDFNCTNIFLQKKIKAEESVTFQNSFSSMADFPDVASVLPAARLIKVESLWLCKKLIDREKPMSLTWLFDCHRSRARNINVAAACELIGAKKGAIWNARSGTHGHV